MANHRPIVGIVGRVMAMFRRKDASPDESLAGLKTALLQLRTALDHVPVAVAWFDNRQKLLFWNQAYANILRSYDFDLDQVRGLRLQDLIEAASADGLRNVLANALLSKTWTEGGEFVAPDGRWLNTRRAPTTDGGFLMVTSDISERREAAAREAQALELAQSGGRAKSEFVANISHEIRTPLNGILGMVQVMQGEAAALPARLKQLTVISDAGHALLGVLNDVLDLSEIELGKLELQPAPFDLVSTVKRATAPYEAVAAEKGVDFIVSIERQARGIWRGDGPKLQKVLANLVCNAVKFTSRGSVEFHIRLAHDGLQFQIIDTGAGVPAQKLEDIFDKFIQADASTTRRFGGAGLGLAICKSLVGVMGGELSVVSTEGIGSAFGFTLPLTRTRRGVGERRKARMGDSRDGPLTPRILAAEDNPSNQVILKSLLEAFGAEVTMVENGRMAVEAFASTCFDLVLMDIQMPEMDGLEATAAIRTLEGRSDAPRTPIIALTANVLPYQTQLYLAAGMDSFLAKPIEARVLFEAIGLALSPPQVADAA